MSTANDRRGRLGCRWAAPLLALLAAGSCSTSHDTAEPSTTVPATTTVEMRPYERGAGPSAGCEASDDELAESTTEGSFEHGGATRAYNLTIPGDVGTEPVPLIVNLHGATGSDDGQDMGTRLAALAEAEGFVLLSPEARAPGRVWDIAPGGADTTFVLALLDEIETTACIDRSRVFATGFSMGGMMATSLSCLQPGRFAAVAPVGGLADVPACASPDRRRSPLIAFQGEVDELVRPDGSYAQAVNVASGLPDGPAREEVAASWANALGCAPEPEVVEDSPVTTTTFMCPGDATVEIHLISGSDHHWPGGDNGFFDTIAPDGEPDASREILDFFEGAVS